MMRNVDASWNFLYSYLQEESKNILNTLVNLDNYQPLKHEIFSPFSVPMDKIKIVILGEEPHVSANLSTGYAYISNTNTLKTWSETAIQKMVENADPDNINISGEIDLRAWIDQGVLLLNTSLTVESGNPGSHEAIWKDFMERLISRISFDNPCIWVVWGKRNEHFIGSIRKPLMADKYDNHTIDNIPSLNDKNYILSGPGPYDKSFGEVRHPYFINKILEKLGKPKMIW